MFRRCASHHPRPGRGRLREEEGCAGFRDGLEVEREVSSAPVAEITDMATAVQKVTLSASPDIPFNKLVLSQGNVRRVKAGVSIEELAEDIVRRTLLQGPQRSADPRRRGTGDRHVRGPGRRPPLSGARTAGQAEAPGQDRAESPVVRDPSTDVSADEDLRLPRMSKRVALHPLDQFRAFQALRDKGLGEEDIAARFFVAPTVVKQRLRLRRQCLPGSSFSTSMPRTRTLEQLMAFTVTSDHARQSRFGRDCLAPTTGKPISSAASSPKALSGRRTAARNSSAPTSMRPPAGW